MRPWPLPPADAPLIHHVTDTHFGYRPWAMSGGVGDRMLADMAKGLIPKPAVMLHTGDLIDDVSEFGGVSPLSAQDAYAKSWLSAADPGVPQLMVPGNHDLWDRPNRLRSEWEAAYGRPGNGYLDIPGYRIVGFCPTFHTSPDTVWQVDDATWSWMDQAVAGAPSGSQVVLADHYPPWELGTSEHVEPHATLDALISGHPSIVGMITGHMHFNIGFVSGLSFVTLGGRNLPVVSSPSSVFDMNITGRDQSARVPPVSSYISLYVDRWEIRYRNHGRHAWATIGANRVTRMNLTAGTVTHGS